MHSKNPNYGNRNLITKRAEFSASHRYWNYDWSAEENKRVFGKQAVEHGHNFVLEVTVEGNVDEQTGMIINLFDLKKIINEVLKDFDHRNLNEDNPSFSGINPTPENIASVLWDELQDEIIRQDVKCTLYNIRLYETADMYVDYRRDQR